MADINTVPLATPLLLGLCRQLVPADLGRREFALDVEANFVSREQGDVGVQDGQMLEGGPRADLSVVVVGGHLEDGGCTVVDAERDPAVDVVVCVLVGREHFVVFHIAFPFGGGKTAECESVAG